jgi:hypothetical protein
MAEASDPKAFPCTISFERDPLELHFQNMRDFNAWLEDEGKAWQPFVESETLSAT